ncbi:response regulator, partial [bacterium]|nr:response regulator [bacterium]
MTENGRIVIVDTDSTFLESTARLLNEDGYGCECIHNVADALPAISREKIGLLVADTTMPGNQDLELVLKAVDINDQLPIILVSKTPSLECAVQAIRLPVIAYLTKPLVAKEFLKMIAFAMDRFKLHQILAESRQQLIDRIGELDNLGNALRTSSTTSHAINSFLITTLQNVFNSLSQLQLIQEIQTSNGFEQDSRFSESIIALIETVEVLKQSKLAFKSKELASLRKKLERLLKDLQLKHF